MLPPASAKIRKFKSGWGLFHSPNDMSPSEFSMIFAFTACAVPADGTTAPLPMENASHFDFITATWQIFCYEEQFRSKSVIENEGEAFSALPHWRVSVKNFYGMKRLSKKTV